MQILEHTNLFASKSRRKFKSIRIAGAVLLGIIGLNRPTVAAAADGVVASAVHSRPNPRIEGMWVWESNYVSDLAEQDKMLDFASRQHFNRLLVQIPWKNARSTSPQINYTTEFARLITEAGKRHIVVEALDGDTHMGDKAQWPRSLATVDAVLAFNKSMPEGSRFVGIHWDIEPYTREDWKSMANRPTIELEYLQLLSHTHQKLHDAGSPMTLAVDIPMWYDNKTDPDDNCILAFNGQTKNLYQHIEDVTDYVGIMSYRQKALGPNSASAMIANEIDYAEKIGKFVCPAYETLQLSDSPTITFFGKSAEQLQSQRKALEDSLADRPGFGGMFIHCYPSVCAVLEPVASAK